MIPPSLRFKARIEVRPKSNELDPEADTINKSLQDLNFPVVSTRSSKVYEVTLEATSKKNAEATVKAMCSRLLANPAKDEYEFEVQEVGGPVSG